MSLYKKIARAVFAATAFFGLAACATEPSLSVAEMGMIREGDQSAIIMSYREYAGMYGASVRFMNVDTRRMYGVSMHGGDNWVNAGPDMVAVPPGRYRILTGSLYGSDVTGNLPMIAYWFDEFNVAPGEVVNIGTLSIDDINVRALPGMSDRVLNALFTLNPSQRNTYYAYTLDFSDEARVQHMLESKYPQLGVAPVQRSPATVLDRAEFERIIVESYAPGADGTMPSVQEAQTLVNESLDRFVRESLENARGPNPTIEVPAQPLPSN